MEGSEYEVSCIHMVSFLHLVCITKPICSEMYGVLLVGSPSPSVLLQRVAGLEDVPTDNEAWMLYMAEPSFSGKRGSFDRTNEDSYHRRGRRFVPSRARKRGGSRGWVAKTT
jgi:hypothetical protein